MRSTSSWLTNRLYTFVFVYVVPWFCIAWSCIHGFASSVISFILNHSEVFWACQGVYLSLNSTDANRGRLAGMFWSIYMTGAVRASRRVHH